MSTIARLTGADFDSMVERRAFDRIGPKKIELIHGELRFMNPAGPIHDDYIRYLTDWSYENTNRQFCSIQVQCGFICDDNRPEPDLAWLRPGRYGHKRPSASDVMLLIEVADSSLSTDLLEKADLYAAGGIAEYWIVDIANRRIHVMSKINDGRFQSIVIHVPPNTLCPQSRHEAILNLADLFVVF